MALSSEDKPDSLEVLHRFRHRLRHCFERPQQGSGSFSKRFKKHLSERRDDSFYCELELIFSTAACGILDVIMFSQFKVFTYNQTGNIVLLGLMASQVMPLPVVPIATTIILFIISGIMLTILGASVGSDKRCWLYSLVILQACLVLFTGVSYLGLTDESTEEGGWGYGNIVMLACVSGSQAAFGRSVYVPDLPGSFWLRNRSFNRCCCIAIAFTAGTLLSAVFVQYFQAAVSLFIFAALKIGVIGLIYAHPALRQIEGETETIPTPVGSGAAQHNIELHDVA